MEIRSVSGRTVLPYEIQIFQEGGTALKKVTRTREQKKQTYGRMWLFGCLLVVAFSVGMLMPSLTGTATGGSSEMSKLQSVLGLLENNWYYAQDTEDLETRLVEQAIAGMTSLEEDPHTNYFNLEQAQQFSKLMSGSNVGIGISFMINDAGNMYVRQVFTNSTADQNGIRKGDQITRVDDLVVADCSAEDLVNYIQKRDGQSIALEIVRDGQTVQTTVTPGSYDTTVSEMIEGDYGEIILNSFSEKSGQEFTEAIGRMKQAGVRNLILDLRGNTGGYVYAVQEIASSLLPEGSVVFQEDDGSGKITEYKTADNYSQVTFDKIYILQNGDTASASEILIGALKDQLPEGSVVTIGSTTYGKGTEQRSVPFEDGTSMKYTVAEWKTPDGTSINNTGFEPDIAVDLPQVQSTGYHEMQDNETIAPDTVHDNAAAVQVFLQFLGYPADRTDSYFSPASSEALKSFQADQGLEATGTVDKTTFDRLIEQISKTMAEQQDTLDTARSKAIELIEQTDNQS